MAGTVLKLGQLQLRINWLIASCVLLVVLGLLRLGLWQLDRAREKLDEQATFLASGQAAPTPLGEVPVAGPQYDLLQHQNRRVVLEGEFMNEQQVFLIYQTYEDQPGYEVVTPFRLAGENLIALVSRGWSGIGDSAELARSLPRLEGKLRVEGQIFVPTAAQLARADTAASVEWPLILRYLDPLKLQDRFQQQLFPYVIRLAEEQPGVLVRHWPQVVVDSGRNFSYALQWFAMAIALALVSLILSSNLLQLLKERGRQD